VWILEIRDGNTLAMGLVLEFGLATAALPLFILFFWTRTAEPAWLFMFNAFLWSNALFFSSQIRFLVRWWKSGFGDG